MATEKLRGEKLKRGVIYREAIKANSLIQMAGGGRVKVSCTAPQSAENHTIIKGRINNLKCHSNLTVHATDTQEVRDHEARAILEPALTCSLILKGKAEGSIGGTPFTLDGREHPTGYIWSMNTPMLWTRQIKKDSHVRKVNITVDRDWLLQEASGTPLDPFNASLNNMLTGPLRIQQWIPTKRALSLAEQMLQPANSAPLLQKMHMESRALEILSEALEGVFSSGVKPEQLPTMGKAQQVRAYIEDHITEPLTLGTIAKSLGMAVNTMQRLFKHSYNMTVMDYLRERRLEIAKDAMERDGCTIAQAAYMAGYSSPANFATAFKKVFGFSPSNITQ